MATSNAAPEFPDGYPGNHLGRRRRSRKLLWSVLAAVVAVALVAAGYLVYQWNSLNNGIHRSDVLGTGVPALDKDQNILLMGLDSRLDENGQALPESDYDALHAGGADVGGYNANVLMLLHVPADGSKATVLSIPRDDYVPLAGQPGGTAEGKIKQAYGLALKAKSDSLQSQGLSDDQVYQQARDAGRKAEVDTVSQFLGGVQIDHFVEITMAAFLGIAKAVAPITVCLNQDTQDTYSGADFKAGEQQLSAEQAVAFVRQRRDTSNPNLAFSDLDRARRQQAFIASLALQLKNKGTLTNISALQGILDAVKSKMAVDKNLDLIKFAQQASALLQGNVLFTTLPISGFGYDPQGEAINTVDPEEIKATVGSLLGGFQSTASQSETSQPGSSQPNESPQPGSSSQPSNADGATPAPSSAGQASPGPTKQNSYDDWTGALQGGAVPCVK